MVTELVHDANLQELIRRSQTRPVLIFKHSTQCPISDSVYQEFLTYLDRAPEVDAGVVLVIENRGLSNAIASHFGVRHESPQVIVIRDGRPVWNASHFAITAAALDRAVRQ